MRIGKALKKARFKRQNHAAREKMQPIKANAAFLSDAVMSFAGL